MNLNKIMLITIIAIASASAITVNAFNEKIISDKEEQTMESNISGVKSIHYKLEGATTKDWTEYNGTFQIQNRGLTFITAKIEDNAGNIVEKTSIAKIGDNISIDNMSNISGIKTVQYRLQGATNTTWTNYTTPFNISTKGLTFVLARAIDNANNISEQTAMIKVGIDDLNGISGIKDVLYKIDGDISTPWTSYTKPLNLTGTGITLIMARAIDNAGNVANEISYINPIVLNNSGIKSIKYKLDGATVKDWTDYSNVFTINNKGITTIFVKAYDNAGNLSSEISVAKIGFENINPSEIDRVEYKLEGATTQDWATYNGAFYVKNEGITTITAIAYDKAGNVSEEVSGTVKIDKASPINNGIKIELL